MNWSTKVFEPVTEVDPSPSDEGEGRPGTSLRALIMCVQHSSASEGQKQRLASWGAENKNIHEYYKTDIKRKTESWISGWLLEAKRRFSPHWKKRRLEIRKEHHRPCWAYELNMPDLLLSSSANCGTTYANAYHERHIFVYPIQNTIWSFLLTCRKTCKKATGTTSLVVRDIWKYKSLRDLGSGEDVCVEWGLSRWRRVRSNNSGKEEENSRI